MDINVITIHKTMMFFIIEYYLKVLNVSLIEVFQILWIAFGKNTI